MFQITQLGYITVENKNKIVPRKSLNLWSTYPSSDSSKLDGSITFLPPSAVTEARLLKFNPVTGVWSSQTTLVYVGQPLPLHDSLKGNCRDALHVQFLHQDEVLGR